MQKRKETGRDLALMSARGQAERESFLKFFRVACVEDEFDVGLPFQTKIEFSYAVAVMDKIGGREEGIEQEDQI